MIAETYQYNRMRHLLTEQSVDYQLRIRLGQFYFKNEHEHSYYKKT